MARAKFYCVGRTRGQIKIKYYCVERTRGRARAKFYCMGRAKLYCLGRTKTKFFCVCGGPRPRSTPRGKGVRSSSSRLG